MKTLTLGHSGIEVSALCLGILPFGTKVDEPTSFAILDAYFDAGGRFIDTANNYSMWHAGGIGTESETVLGKWMQARGNRSQLVDRDQGRLQPGGHRAQPLGSHHRRRVGRQLASPGMLNTSICIMPTPTSGRIRSGGDVGGVRHGSSRQAKCGRSAARTTWPGGSSAARQISRSHGWAEYCCVQQRFTYLRPQPGASFGPQRSGNDDLLDYCQANPDFRMLAYSPLLAGAYTRTDKPLPKQYAGADSDQRLAALAAIAAEIGATPNQVIYAWLLGGQPSIIPLTAPTSLAQLEENLKSLAVSLAPEQMERLTTAGNP